MSKNQKENLKTNKNNSDDSENSNNSENFDDSENSENSSQSIENKLKNISNEINNLSKETKLKNILKKHRNIKENISNVSQEIDQIKISFDSDVENNQEIIDDETFEKYSKEINDFIDLNHDELELTKFVKKYKSINKKIYLCEIYLKNKKMELIDCDKLQQNDKNDQPDL